MGNYLNKQAHLTRRTFSREYKQKVVEQVLAGAESCASIARQHDLNANQLAMWVKHCREGTGWAKHIRSEVGPPLIPLELVESKEKVVAADKRGLVNATLKLASGRVLEFHDLDAGSLTTLLEVVS